MGWEVGEPWERKVGGWEDGKSVELEDCGKNKKGKPVGGRERGRLMRLLGKRKWRNGGGKR